MLQFAPFPHRFARKKVANCNMPQSKALAAIQSNILTRSAFQLKLEKLNKVYLYSLVASCALATVMCFDYLSGNFELKLKYLIAPVVYFRSQLNWSGGRVQIL
ncbi:MAG: hypothetical protein HLUCCO02_11655 [Idiomarinaceae bacterium HL-53]|nr:MAG: hypothetical protein HLUCCO02_11655 [Idiomarinaceae bacterium HL-53]